VKKVVDAGATLEKSKPKAAAASTGLKSPTKMDSVGKSSSVRMAEW
jgi:hypothetical protein